MSEPFPPKILIVEGFPSSKPFRYATLIGVQDGMPAYCPEPLTDPLTRLEADTNRALALIGKALGS